MIKIGTLKKLKVSHLGNKMGTTGVCFYILIEAKQSLFSFIFPNGEYDVFSVSDHMNELDIFFLDWESFDSSLSSYVFENRDILLNNYDSGSFNRGFNK
jgi:hypothetical protein